MHVGVGIYGRGVHIFLDRREVEQVKHLLLPEERVEMAIRQRNFGPGGDLITPTTMVATNRRLIIVYRTALGMRKYYEVIPFRRITSVRIEHGIISSSIHFHVLGIDREKAMRTGKHEGVVDGLREHEAAEFAKFLDKHIVDVSPQNAAADEAEFGNPASTSVFCRTCGAKELASSQFCRNCGAKLH